MFIWVIHINIYHIRNYITEDLFRYIFFLKVINPLHIDITLLMKTVFPVLRRRLLFVNIFTKVFTVSLIEDSWHLLLIYLGLRVWRKSSSHQVLKCGVIRIIFRSQYYSLIVYQYSTNDSFFVIASLKYDLYTIRYNHFTLQFDSVKFSKFTVLYT